ncbi:MAG: terpene cyclase/mutase family protein [Planctomycetes bacterium]|nr:terpene cyclase/mutase family protein [Planctomycetota bacterium]
MTVSLFLHSVLLILLSMIYFNLPMRELLDSMLTLVIASEQSSGEDLEIDLPSESDEHADSPHADSPPEQLRDELAVVLPDVEIPLKRPVHEAGGEPIPKSDVTVLKVVTQPKNVTRKETAKKGAKSTDVEAHVDHFVGRTAAAKSALLKRMGGTDASEAAVAKGLLWLKYHQLPDGSWNFNHTLIPRCDCTMPGRLINNPNGATAMALLAFLGAGQTHEEGDYQEEVQRGLAFLVAGGTPAGKGICFYGQLQGPPTFYTHGLSTIALSEAYAMTHDPDLRPPLTGAIEFLAATQHQQGGWRYFPGQPGDTSVVAWELMALKSAQFSRVTVPPKVFQGIERFLASVSSLRGSQYSYTPERQNSPTPSMTAAGLLCRMYLDWNESSVPMRAGIRFLDEHGPDRDDMYFNYYATQVMHHWGHEEWDRWNPIMRDHLIRTQITGGHALGSWDVADRHGNMGGRLYMTTLALLTLEVYYRHLPLYQKERIEIPLNPAAAPAK